MLANLLPWLGWLVALGVTVYATLERATHAAARRTLLRWVDSRPPHYPSDLRDFTKRFCPDQFRSTPGFPDRATSVLRVQLLQDELDELDEAITLEDLDEVADALADLNYVVHGAALAFGIDLDAVHREVHSSNMNKTHADGTVLRDAMGKVLKPPHWQPPNIRKVLCEQCKRPLSLTRVQR